MNDKEKLDMFNRIVSNNSNAKEQMYNRIVSNYNDYKKNQSSNIIQNSQEDSKKFSIISSNREKFKTGINSLKEENKKKKKLTFSDFQKDYYNNTKKSSFTQLEAKERAEKEGISKEEALKRIVVDDYNNKAESAEKNKDKKSVLENIGSGLNYINKEAGVGVVGGLNGIFQSTARDWQYNLNKGGQKSILEASKDVGKSFLLNPINAVKAPIEAGKKTFDILSDSNSNLVQKGQKLATEMPSYALNQFGGVKQIQQLGQLGGAIFKGSDEKVKNVADTVSKPYYNMREKLDEEAKQQSQPVRVLGTVSNAIGNMAPSIASSAFVGPQASLMATGMSAKGSSTEDLLRKGVDLETAKKAGDTKGLVEVGTEMLTGGVNIFGKGALDDIVEKGIAKKVKSNVGQFLLKQGYDFTGEVGEEVISDIIGTLVDRETIEPDKTYSLADLGETTTTTILTTAVLKALGVPVQKINNKILTNSQEKVQKEKNETSELTESKKESESNISTSLEEKNSQNAISEQIDENTKNIDNSMQENNENKKILYHQTSASSLADFDLKNRKAGLSDTSTPKGIFLKDTDVDIGLEGKNQLKFETLMNNTLEVKNREELKKIISQNNERYANIIDNENKSDDYYSNKNELLEKEIDKLYEKYYYEENPDKKSSYKRQMDELQLQQDDLINEWRNGGLNIAETAQDEITKTLKEMGYDSVIIEEDEGSFGRKIKSYVVLDTSQLKELTNQQNYNLKDTNIANNKENMYNINESEGGNNEQIQLGRMLEGNAGLSGIYEEDMQQSRKYTREEYNEWESNIKPLGREQLNEQQLKIKDNIKRQYNKDIVFFDGTNSDGYSAGASYIDKNRINIDVEQAKTFGTNKMIYHEVAESDILHNPELSTDVIQPAIQKIIEDPNFESQKLEFWKDQEEPIPNDYLIAKDILCDRFSELKTGEKNDYKNVLSQETNMTIDFSLNNFHENLHNSKIQKDGSKIDFTRKINKETAIDKYNEYKQNILKGRAEEVNALIKNKNETINSLEQKLAEKKLLLEQKADKDTVEANRIKIQIGTLQQRINRIENEYNSRIDRKNEKVTKDNIKLQLRKETKTTRKDIQEGLLEKTGLKSENFDDAKNITMINLNRTSPERVNEKVFGHELGTKVNDAIISPTKHNEAEKTRFKNKEREEIKGWGIKDHSKESAILQKYAEKSYVNENDELVSYTEADLKRDIKDEKTRQKIRNAAKELRAKYDMYIDRANNVLVELGYDPIPKRDDYVRHFNELNDIFTRFGIPGKIQNENALPTDINGITDTFLPGKSYFANTQKRQGIKTTYDAITGIDGYIEGISNLIYHTEDIQRLRAFEKHIRETYGEPGWLKMDGLTEEQKTKRAQNINNHHLSNYAAWLTEYTNNLAGKKNGIDRSIEKLFGRNIYSIANTVKKQTGSNMTGFNISSALSNFVSVIQGYSKTKKKLKTVPLGLNSTFKNIFFKDDFIEKSDFLTTRFGSDRIHKTMWEKMSNAGQIFMNATDYFTANLIVRTKYYENLSNGMSESEAIKKADDFGARIMGDRALGSTPVIFNSKTLGFVTQFQFEVFNQYDSMIHDTIQDYKVTKGNKGALRASMGAVWSLGQLMAFSYFFNNAYEAILGTRPAFDAIGIIKIAFGLDDDDDSEDTLQDNLQQASKKLVEGLPIINLFSENARIPTASGIPNPIKLATGESTWKDEKKKFIYLLPPTGGNQVKKTYQGAKALIEGGSYTTSKNGEKKLQFTVDNKEPKEITKALLFGKWSTSNAKIYDSKPLTEKEQEEMEELNISFKDYKKYKADLSKINKIEADKDSNGKSISGSSHAKKAYQIMNSNYSDEEKEYLIKKLYSEDSKTKISVNQLKKIDNSEESYKYFFSMSSEKQRDFLNDMKEYNFTSKKLMQYYKSKERIDNEYENEIKKVKSMGYRSEIEKEKVNTLNQLKKTEIAEKLLDSNYSDKQKLFLYSKSYKTNDVEMAQKLNIDANSFIKFDSQNFESDYYANGKTVKNSKINKVVRYVESLPNLTIAQKALLIKSEMSSYKKYDNQIIEYIDNQKLSNKEKEEILKNVGFKIKNGRVYD